MRLSKFTLALLLLTALLLAGLLEYAGAVIREQQAEMRRVAETFCGMGWQ
jgi:hypothetical protein